MLMTTYSGKFLEETIKAKHPNVSYNFAREEIISFIRKKVLYKGKSYLCRKEVIYMLKLNVIFKNVIENP